MGKYTTNRNQHFGNKMQITNTISKANVVTSSSFPAITVTLPKMDQIPKKDDIFSLPIIQPLKKENKIEIATPKDKNDKVS
jgi:hypothetical protein